MRHVDASTDAPPEATPDSSSVSFLRPKGNASTAQLCVLAVLVALPLLMVAVRLAGHPGTVGAGEVNGWSNLVHGIATFLDRTLSLTSVRPEIQERLLHVLFMPACAMMVVLVRLTLGIRLLGPFRSILIALAFQVAGVILGLILITVVIVTVVAVRPVLKRIRLPYYARVSVILSFVAATMIGLVLLGPLVQPGALWRVVFAPVVVLGLMAEGFARTLEREGLPAALWRATTTVLLAVLIALASYVPALQQILLQFPELIVVEVAAIILVSEFLDLRLLQGWDAAATGASRGRLFSENTPHRIAVVRNRDNTGIIGRLGPATPEKYGRRSVQRIIDALRDSGHTVRVFEGDMTLLPQLQSYIPADSRTGEPGGIVFNLAYGIQGDARYTHVPGMLEMAGIPYTGATPLGHAFALDKVVAKVLMQQAGVPTPRFCLTGTPNDGAGDLRYPLIVKPRHESSSFGLSVVYNHDQLAESVDKVVTRYQQQALVEEYIAGREINAGVLGNDPVECLPLVELDFGNREIPTLTWADKFHKSDNEPDKLCPAPLDENLAARINRCALATFHACHCRDYARVDIRVDQTGTPYVLEINSIATLGWGGSFVLAAKEAGYTFTDLMCRIVEVARERYAADGAAGTRPALALVPPVEAPVAVAPNAAVSAG